MPDSRVFWARYYGRFDELDMIYNAASSRGYKVARGGGFVRDSFVRVLAPKGFHEAVNKRVGLV